MGQGRLWPTGEWRSRSTPSFGNSRCVRHLRFVPMGDMLGLSHLRTDQHPLKLLIEILGAEFLNSAAAPAS